jgi:uncharacterized protein
MRITLTGANGFLGKALTDRLLRDGHQLRMLVRKPLTGWAPEIEMFLWDPPKSPPPPESLSGADAVIHLAGATVNQRWTEDAKALIRSSRVDPTRTLVQALSAMEARPKLFLSASAIGFYGDRASEVLNEVSAPGTGYLADVCLEWEKEALLAKALGIRVSLLRTGIVLGRGGGALESMLPPFRFGVGGKLGGGEQYMSWIHIEDWVGIVLHLLKNGEGNGPLNLTAPNPVPNSEFTRVLGRALSRPALFTIPAFALKAIFGEMSVILLASQRAVPKAAEGLGYRFQHPQLESALRSLL